MNFAISRRTRSLLLVFFTLGLAFFEIPSALLQVPEAAPVFEIELPEFNISPSTRPELVVPSSNVNQVFLHVLRPVADNVDYSGIRTSVNGQAAATIAEILSGARGKLVKINLKQLPGFEFVTGRNSVEIWAQNRRGRQYYSSFVIRTATENRNEEFGYRVQLDSKKNPPPELVLLEPERAIEFPAGRKTLVVRISGIATAATSIKRISVNAKNVAVRSGAQVGTRKLGLANEDKRVGFDTSVTLYSAAGPVLVEAEDLNGSRTELSVPVVTGASEPVNQFHGRKYALIVGISNYKNNAEGIPDLQFADTDAQAVHRLLQRPPAGGFLPDDMLLITNEQATVANIRQALTSFVGKASSDDLLLIFIAGHGAPDPAVPQNLYVLASDTTVHNMSQTAIAMPHLRKYVEENVRAKRVVFLLDTCHSAGLTTEITRALANNLVNLYVEKMLYQEEGRAIITSSDVNELARESTRWGNGHGVFTFYVLEGLKGKADTNQDRLVSVGELFRFVRQKVRLDTEFKQNPRMLVGANENLALSVARR